MFFSILGPPNITTKEEPTSRVIKAAWGRVCLTLLTVGLPGFLGGAEAQEEVAENEC